MKVLFKKYSINGNFLQKKELINAHLKFSFEMLGIQISNLGDVVLGIDGTGIDPLVFRDKNENIFGMDPAADISLFNSLSIDTILQQHQDKIVNGVISFVIADINGQHPPIPIFNIFQNTGFMRQNTFEIIRYIIHVLHNMHIKVSCISTDGDKAAEAMFLNHQYQKVVNMNLGNQSYDFLIVRQDNELKIIQPNILYDTMNNREKYSTRPFCQDYLHMAKNLKNMVFNTDEIKNG